MCWWKEIRTFSLLTENFTKVAKKFYIIGTGNCTTSSDICCKYPRFLSFFFKIKIIARLSRFVVISNLTKYSKLYFHLIQILSKGISLAET